MRHGNKTSHLGRKAAHRTSMLANMTCSSTEYRRINTTSARAEALKIFVEPLMAELKSDITHNRRVAFNKLHNRYTVTGFFKEVATKVGSRPGGCTRTIKLDNCLRGNAEMTLIRFVDYSATYSTTKVAKEKITHRSREKTIAEEVAQPVQAIEAAAE